MCKHTGWLLDALVMLVASAEAQELQLARERRFDRTCNDLQRLRARACALVLYLASALDFVLGVKAVPRFSDGLLVRFQCTHSNEACVRRRRPANSLSPHGCALSERTACIVALGARRWRFGCGRTMGPHEHLLLEGCRPSTEARR